jgi:hypothetical protein
MTVADVLVGKRHPIGASEHTLRIAISAFRKGDYRLAASRALTAAVQAASAAVGGSSEVVERAEKVIFQARLLIQSLVIARAVRLGHVGGPVHDHS